MNFEKPDVYNWKKSDSMHTNMKRVDEIERDDLHKQSQQEDFPGVSDFEVIEDFVLSSLYEEEVRKEYKKFQEILENMLYEGRFAELLELAKSLLQELGIKEGMDRLDIQNSWSGVLLAEAVNLSAKEINSRMYYIKPAVVIAAWKKGAQFGYNRQDGTYSLFHKDVGTASFHDPSDEICYIIENILQEDVPEWPYPWSEVYRQNLAFDLIQDLSSGKRLIKELARETTPEELLPASERYVVQYEKDIFCNSLIIGIEKLDEEAIHRAFEAYFGIEEEKDLLLRRAFAGVINNEIKSNNSYNLDNLLLFAKKFDIDIEMHDIESQKKALWEN